MKVVGNIQFNEMSQINIFSRRMARRGKLLPSIFQYFVNLFFTIGLQYHMRVTKYQIVNIEVD